MVENKKDWYKEVSLKSGVELRDWWNAEAGIYEVEFLSEANEEYTVNYGSLDKPDTKIKIPFDIRVNGKEYVWGVTKAITETSLYGQLVLLARKNNGLEGTKTKVLVQGSGKSKRYIIPEVIENDKSEEIPTEKVE